MYFPQLNDIPPQNNSKTCIEYYCFLSVEFSRADKIALVTGKVEYLRSGRNMEIQMTAVVVQRFHSLHQTDAGF